MRPRVAFALRITVANFFLETTFNIVEIWWDSFEYEIILFHLDAPADFLRRTKSERDLSLVLPSEAKPNKIEHRGKQEIDVPKFP
jgi:hypothetical protein